MNDDLATLLVTTASKLFPIIGIKLPVDVTLASAALDRGEEPEIHLGVWLTYLPRGTCARRAWSC